MTDLRVVSMFPAEERSLIAIPLESARLEQGANAGGVAGDPIHPNCLGAIGACCAVNGSPGCHNLDCCAAVCACDSFCCDVAWDELCVFNNPDVPDCDAVTLCGCDPLTCGTPYEDGNNLCCQPSFTATCADAKCCDAVCACDPFCCDEVWDLACVLALEVPGCGAIDLCDGGCPKPYSNFLTPSGTLFFAGFEAAQRIVADDLQLIRPGAVTEIGFSIWNHFINSQLQTVSLDLHFWKLEFDEKGEVLEPVLGEEIVILTVEGFVQLPTGQAALVTVHLDEKDSFSVPEFLWAGMKYNVTGTTFSAGGNANALGQIVMQHPEIGFSNDFFWQTGGTVATGFYVFGGCPICANFAWQITIDDEMEATCPGDVDGNGVVDVFDLLALLSCWGAVQPGCGAADLTGNGVVDVFDLLDLLANWGPCP